MIVRQGDSFQQARDRAVERAKRRRDNARFIAESQGVTVLLNYKGAQKKLDHLTSLYVRRRDRLIHAGLCLVCMAKQRLGLLERAPEPIQVAYHIVPRGDTAVRFNLINVIGACKRCNDGERWSRTRASLRERYRLIHIEVLGGGVEGGLALACLETMARIITHFSTADLLAKCEETKQLLEGSNGQHRL